MKKSKLLWSIVGTVLGISSTYGGYKGWESWSKEKVSIVGLFAHQDGVPVLFFKTRAVGVKMNGQTICFRGAESRVNQCFIGIPALVQDAEE